MKTRQSPKQNDLVAAFAPMMKSVFEMFIPTASQAKPPEDKNVREQIEFIAGSLYSLPGIKETVGGFLNEKQFTGLFYEMTQDDLDELYDIIHQAEALKDDVSENKILNWDISGHPGKEVKS